jgi:hypothetical protein
VALYTKGLVVLAGVETTTTAARTVATGSVGIDGNQLARLKTGRNAFAYLFYNGADFVPGNDGLQGHSVTTAEGVEVGTAKADVTDAQQHLAGSGLWRWKFDDFQQMSIRNL